MEDSKLWCPTDVSIVIEGFYDGSRLGHATNIDYCSSRRKEGSCVRVLRSCTSSGFLQRFRVVRWVKICAVRHVQFSRRPPGWSFTEDQAYRSIRAYYSYKKNIDHSRSRYSSTPAPPLSSLPILPPPTCLISPVLNCLKNFCQTRRSIHFDDKYQSAAWRGRTFWIHIFNLFSLGSTTQAGLGV